MTSINKQQMNKEKGVALIVVLLVVALVSMIATDLTGRLQREIRRSTNVFDHQQAQSYTLGAEKFAIAVLEKDLDDHPERVDLAQAWATQGLYFPVEGGDLTGVITDASSCFNVNSIVSRQNELGYIADKEGVAYQAYLRLLTLLGLSQGLGDSLADWLDSNQQVGGMDGAEDLDYELLTPAYRAANGLIVDVSELNLIQGYTADIMKKLRPYVCALPDNYLKLNINTIDREKPELLAMLIKDLPVSSAATLLAERKQSGYDSLISFWQLEALAGLEIDTKTKAMLRITSDYYLLRARAQIGRGHQELTTLFKHVNKQIHIIWRHFGTVA